VGSLTCVENSLLTCKNVYQLEAVWKELWFCYILHSSYSKSCLQSAILKKHLCQPFLALSEMKLHVSSTFHLQSNCIKVVILIYIIKILIFWWSSFDIAYFVCRWWLLYRNSVILTCLVRKPCICSFLKWKILVLILLSISTS